MKKITFAFAIFTLLNAAVLFGQSGGMSNQLGRHPASSDPANNRPALYRNGQNHNGISAQSLPDGPRRMEPIRNSEAPRGTIDPAAGRPGSPVRVAPAPQRPAPTPVYRGQNPPRCQPAPPPAPVAPPAPAPAPKHPSFLERLLHPIINLQFQL